MKTHVIIRRGDAILTKTINHIYYIVLIYIIQV